MWIQATLRLLPEHHTAFVSEKIVSPYLRANHNLDKKGLHCNMVIGYTPSQAHELVLIFHGFLQGELSRTNCKKLLNSPTFPIIDHAIVAPSSPRLVGECTHLHPNALRRSSDLLEPNPSQPDSPAEIQFTLHVIVPLWIFFIDYFFCDVKKMSPVAQSKSPLKKRLCFKFCCEVPSLRKSCTRRMH